MIRSKVLPEQQVTVELTTLQEDSLPEEEDPSDDLPVLTFPGNGSERDGERTRIKQLFNEITRDRPAAATTRGDKFNLAGIYSNSTREQINQVRTSSISVLWHELLTPVSLIKGYTATLMQLKHSITEEQKGRYLAGIDSACNKVVRLLENLREITRLEENDDLATESVSLSKLLRQVVTETQNQTTKNVIKLRPSSRLPLIQVDPQQIELVLNNLLVNAIKYSPQGGDIEVGVNLVQNKHELRRMFGNAPVARLPSLIVSVADAGIGIPEGELSQIFQKFYRVNTKLTRTTPGAGLGLYICKIIVEAYGGQIWAGNRLNGGSVFSFSLPLE